MPTDTPPNTPAARLRTFWVRFYERELKSFEYHGPWWISGTSGDGEVRIVCAAVMATGEEAARNVIKHAFDKPRDPTEWDFVEERDADWSPFCDRFGRREWMRWPWPSPEAARNKRKGARP